MGKIFVAFLLVVHAGLLAWQGWRYSPTIDEPGHLIAGLSHWKFANFDLYRVNPPLVRLVASVPVLAIDPPIDWSSFSETAYSRPEFRIGIAFVETNGRNAYWYFTLARWMCIPFSLIGGLYCYRWSRELYGEPAGCVALILWCFCPNILGNGALITPDVASASMGVVAGYYFWHWLRAPRWSAAILAGLTLGLAELTKTTWIVLFCAWPMLWGAWCLLRQMSAANCLKSIGQLGVILGLALYLLNLGYGFERSFQCLGEFQFTSRSLGGPAAHETPSNRFAGTWLSDLPVPAPENYVLGIDVQKYDFERGKVSYLRGEWKHGGWWYYYLYAMAVKLPVGTLLLFGMACCLKLGPIIRCRRIAVNSPMPVKEQGGHCGVGREAKAAAVTLLDELTLLLPAVIVLALISSQTGFNRYLRYAIPAFPFLLIWISQVARTLQRPPNPRFLSATSIGSLLANRESSQNPPVFTPFGSRCSLIYCGDLLPLAVIVLVTASVVSSLAVFPHSLSYFNEIAGGPQRGSDHLLDANIDWSQDVLSLKAWQDAHPEARPFYAVQVGPIDPTAAGIDIQARPRHASIDEVPTASDDGLSGALEGFASGSASVANVESHQAAKVAAAPGWYAIGVNDLLGYNDFGERRPRYDWLQAFEPVAKVGYSIQIFHITPEMLHSQGFASYLE